MSNRREVITLLVDDDDEVPEDGSVGNTTENQVQRLERELRSSKNNATYVQEHLEGKLDLLQAEYDSLQAKYARLQAQDAHRKAENARLQAETARLQAENAQLKVKYARPRAQLQAGLLEDHDEDDRPSPDSPSNDERHSRRTRGSHQETHHPKRPRTEAQDPIDARQDLQTNFANNNQLDGREEADKKITVRVNQDGDLETDSQVDDEAWNKLVDTWQRMKQRFDSKSSDWASIDLENKCVWGAVVSAPTTHYWTRKQPGEFACRSCANKRRICVGRVGGNLQLLPLPPVPVSARHRVTNQSRSLWWLSRKASVVAPAKFGTDERDKMEFRILEVA